MKKYLFTTVMTGALLFGAIGCSDDDPKAPNDPGTGNTATTTWDATGQFWRSQVDATNTDNFTYFSFTSRDVVTTGVPKVTTGTNWDIAFRREVPKLNGGQSTVGGGDVVGVDLGAVSFSAVTVADTAGKTWVADAIAYFIDDWYTYTGPPSHQFIPNQNVYSMVDAEGDNYIKFRIDSLSGAGAPPNMGTVYITYYYQPTAGSKDLSGATTTAAITVASGTGYFDFSTGTQVNPANPTTSMDWDLAFSSYEVKQNSGPNGPGDAKAFYAYTELTDPTDIDAFTLQPNAPLFPDVQSCALTEWYNYTGAPLHQLLSKNNVYLLKSQGVVYKLQIESYYKNVGGNPTSGWYTFIWKSL